ncbi:N-acetyltransferase family protein, partial [Rubrivirga sp.]|uniref:GNAT family N-acetyltransferase n=1 Tax=Rubrivirga sp. TaxID=1885344 RepID=UPI003C72202B
RSPASRIWLALEGGAAVGLVTAHLYEPAPMYRPSLMVHVDDLYVTPTSRGRGVGSRLIDEARQWGLSQGATELRAGVLAANGAGRAFWETERARDYSVTVVLDLEGDRGR